MTDKEGDWGLLMLTLMLAASILVYLLPGCTIP
jgi:hypothetical protein